jgi:hypothetical protein
MRAVHYLGLPTTGFVVLAQGGVFGHGATRGEAIAEAAKWGDTTADEIKAGLGGDWDIYAATPALLAEVATDGGDARVRVCGDDEIACTRAEEAEFYKRKWADS